MSVLKVIIPMAGRGKRLEPLTLHRPKALVRLAGKRLLDHVISTFDQLEGMYSIEYIFIIGHLGEQIRTHMQQAHPYRKVTYFVQEQLLGQSNAVFLAREAVSGPVILTFCDTVNITDFSFLPLTDAEGATTVREVEDPSRFGVAASGPDGIITRLIEKPKSREHRAALTGIYYFSEGRALMQAIETQLNAGMTVNNEYYLADAINILIQQGKRIRAVDTAEWLDAGTPSDLLQTNARLLQIQDRSPSLEYASTVIHPPVFIAESARVEGSAIGPNVAIGENCVVRNATIRNSIVDDGTAVTGGLLEDSLIGKDCIVEGASTLLILGDREQINSRGNS